MRAKRLHVQFVFADEARSGPEVEADGEGKEKVKDLDARRFPVDDVSWVDAVSFCRKLTDRDAKRRFDLPSEAE